VEVGVLEHRAAKVDAPMERIDHRLTWGSSIDGDVEHVAVDVPDRERHAPKLSCRVRSDDDDERQKSLPNATERDPPRRASYLPRVARAAVEAASPSTLAPALVRWARAAGFDVTRYVEPAMAEADEGMTTARALARLFDALAEHFAEPHVALRLPAELSYRRHDAVALACIAATSPADVLRIHARWAELVFPQLEGSVREETRAGVTTISFDASIRGYPRGLGIRVETYLVALVLHRCRRGGTNTAPLRVTMTAARPRDVAPLALAFGTHEIVFGEERFGFDLLLDDARRALPGGDAALMGTAEHLASAAMTAAPRTGALAESVIRRIEERLPGIVTTDDVAALLHMSARTLQRRLEAEGTRFTELLDRVRERQARRLLVDSSLGLAEIAYRAGFADLATFSRAFKRWTGVPPGAFRRRGDQ
jgi:AraC-like DNA-binding protein